MARLVIDSFNARGWAFWAVIFPALCWPIWIGG